MFETFRNMFAVLSDPQELHAVLVHLPVAGSIFGLVLAIILAVTRGRSHGVRWSCAAVYLIAAIVAFMAADIGGDAKVRLSEMGATLTPQMVEHIETHEGLGQRVWIWLATTTILVALTAVTQKRVRTIAMVVAVLAGVFTLGWVTMTAYYGGSLVYGYGVGVPTSSANLNPPAVETPMEQAVSVPAVPADQHEPDGGGQ